MGEILLEVENLGKLFGRRRVFKGISGRVGSGELVRVVGSNGSGKSTLLRIFCGLTRPSEGKVRFLLDGEEAAGEKIRKLVGWVAPALSLYGELSGIENLRFILKVRGCRHGEKDLEALLARVGLEGRGGDEVQSFSTGMKVRLKYAQAILHDPKVLLLDEPYSNLDAEGREFVDSLVTEWLKKGIVVMASPGKDGGNHEGWIIDLDE